MGELPFSDHRSHLQRRFSKFHKDNPHVYEMFKRFTMQAIESGRTRFGARMVWERMRWYTMIEAREARFQFKLNDHYPPYYARLFMDEHPRYQGFFELRRVRGERQSLDSGGASV